MLTPMPTHDHPVSAHDSGAKPEEIFPPFFAQAPLIVMHDGLAEFLGAARGGRITYTYADAVRLAGHSCPTVATAYLMAAAALRRLYGETPPRRGEISVDCGAAKDSGVTGVMASIFTLITGAAEEGGFRGIGARFSRRGLLRFGQPCGGEFRLTRLDNAAAVEVSGHPERVAGDGRMRELMPLCLAGQASAAQEEQFRMLWQERVRHILLGADDPELIVVRAL